MLAAAIERLAARLQDRAARLIAAAAGDRAAIGRVIALADAAGEIALANGQAVQSRAARAQSAGECLAKILQRRARHFVVARAVDLEAFFAFLEPQLAAGDDAPTGRRCTGRQTCRRGSDSRGSGRPEKQSSLQYHRARHRNDSFQKPVDVQPFTVGLRSKRTATGWGLPWGASVSCRLRRERIRRPKPQMVSGFNCTATGSSCDGCTFWREPLQLKRPETSPVNGVNCSPGSGPDE